MLLIVIAVAAAVVTYSFVMGFIGGAAITPGGISDTITVTGVITNATNHSVASFIVTNTGAQNVTVASASLVLVSSGATVDATTTLTGNTTISAGNSEKITCTLTGVQGATYYLLVTTAGGGSAPSPQFTMP